MKITADARKLARQLYRESFTGGEIDPAKVAGATGRVASERPRHFIQALRQYHRLLRLDLEKRRAVVEGATPLSPATAAAVESNIKTRYGPGVTCEFRVNPELIGGLRLRVGSDVWDGSVRGRLETLGKTFDQS